MYDSKMDMTAMVKFVTFISFWILINDTSIICLSSKNMQFCTIRRLWLKNWVCHTHLKLKIQKGVVGSIFGSTLNYNILLQLSSIEMVNRHFYVHTPWSLFFLYLMSKRDILQEVFHFLRIIAILITARGKMKGNKIRLRQ